MQYKIVNGHGTLELYGGEQAISDMTEFEQYQIDLFT